MPINLHEALLKKRLLKHFSGGAECRNQHAVHLLIANNSLLYVTSAQKMASQIQVASTSLTTQQIIRIQLNKLLNIALQRRGELAFN